MSQAPPDRHRQRRSDDDGADARPAVVLTLGKLDGVHAGHRHLAAHVLEEASRRGVRGAALVLHPHPAAVLHGAQVPLLTTVAERCRRLRAFGLAIVEPLQFTEEVARLTPEAFLDRLARRFQLAAMVVGPDFAFGRDRAGTTDTLRALGAERGFDVVVVPPLVVGLPEKDDADCRRVSSGWLREALGAGRIEVARTLLRAPPQLTGTVVHGAARGRELGFPTANLDLSAPFVLPANGVYTVRASWPTDDDGGIRHADGVASIGVRPVFDAGAKTVEVHLLDFSGDLYGRHMTVELLANQRAEQDFPSVDALVEQMHADVALARERLAAEAAPAWERTGEDELTVRGHDLAALCEHAAAAMMAVGGGGAGPGEANAVTGDVGRTAIEETSVRRVRISAADTNRGAVGEQDPVAERTLLARWLKTLVGWTGSGQADGEPDVGERPLSASVYHAGVGVLHAVVRAAAGSGVANGLPAVSVHGGVERDGDGFRSVRLIDGGGDG